MVDSDLKVRPADQQLVRAEPRIEFVGQSAFLANTNSGLDNWRTRVTSSISSSSGNW
ncbi:MAG: hypothetical protein H6514_09610 [Acidimicrobiaceae bacterium]|nr:hypothetical protein [Acidimicrobiaceae bacterium]